MKMSGVFSWRQQRWDHWSLSPVQSRLQNAWPEKLGSAFLDPDGFSTGYSIYSTWEVSLGFGLNEAGEENIIYISEVSHNAKGKNLVTVHSTQPIQGNQIYIY